MTAPLLVIAHEATRTGSPRVLLELLRYSVARLDAPVAVRLLAGGPLSDELLSVATAPDGAEVPAAVLVNGALAADELGRFAPGVASLVYVHEEGEALRTLGADARIGLAERANRVLCVSERSRDGLIELGVPRERIAVLAPVVVERSRPTHEAIEQARHACGVSGTDRLVLGCGEAGWRKGADLFVAVAHGLAASSEARFAWVGRRGRSFGRVLDHDTAELELADRMRWIDEVEDASPFLAAADLLVMTSREDPQPLVPLEAAMMGTPTVGFAVGGLVDLAAAGAAAVAPYPDVAALATLAAEVLGHPAHSDTLVAGATSRVAERQSIAVVGPRFVNELESLLAGTGPDTPRSPVGGAQP